MKFARVALLFIILAITGAYAGKMSLQFGSYVARAVGTSGNIRVSTTGGSGTYSLKFTQLPAGWTAQGSTITIPNINSISQSFNCEVQVRDAATSETFVANLIIQVNGVRVTIAQGGAVGGTFGSTTGGSSGSTSGSTTTTTTTSGSTNSASPISPSSAITSLYSNYNGLPTGSPLPQGPASFPSPSGSPRTPNPAPAIIANAQAPYNPTRDSNTITVQDVKRTAIFNRQINANKAVANLVSIVQRLTANVNAATNDINVLTQLLRDAQDAYSACQNQVFNLANVKAKIQNAIADRETTISSVNGKIAAAQPMLDGLQMALDKLIADRNRIEKQRSPNAGKLADLENQLAKCLAEKNDLIKQLEDLKKQIDGVATDIQNTKDRASGAPGVLDQINRQIPIVDKTIADLERQLADAKAQKAQLLADKKDTQAIIDAANAEVKRLQGILDGLKGRVPGLESQIAAKDANCKRIEQSLNAFRNQLAGIENSYNVLLGEIEAQKALVDSKKAEIEALKKSIADLPNELKLLREELGRIQTALRRQYFICDSLADDVRRAKQNLEAMRTRLAADSDSLRLSNANLEAARAQKQLADVAVEQILSVYTSALPFAIIPNGNGATNAGTPIGNNPSGSPLGPVAIQTNTVNQQSVVVGDLNSYLSTAYRAGVDPSRPNTVTTLYPLSVLTINALVGNRGLNNFSCGSSSQTTVTGQGSVQSVKEGAVVVSTNNGPVNLNVAPCSNLQSTTQGQVLRSGDQVYFKGTLTAGNSVNLQSLTCVNK